MVLVDMAEVDVAEVLVGVLVEHETERRVAARSISVDVVGMLPLR